MMIKSLISKIFDSNYKERGDHDYQNAKFNSAINNYKKALVQTPNNSKLYTHLGSCYVALKDAKNAKFYIEKAIILDEKDSENYFVLGNLFGCMGNNIEAINNYKKSVELQENNHEKSLIYYNMGYSYSILEKDNEAIDSFSEALKYDSFNYEIYYSRSISYSILTEYQKAIKDCDIGIEINPNFSGFYYVKALALKELNSYEDAIKNLDKAVELGYGIEALKQIEIINKLKKDCR